MTCCCVEDIIRPCCSRYACSVTAGLGEWFLNKHFSIYNEKISNKWTFNVLLYHLAIGESLLGFSCLTCFNAFSVAGFKHKVTSVIGVGMDCNVKLLQQKGISLYLRRTT